MVQNTLEVVMPEDVKSIWLASPFLNNPLAELCSYKA